ncbi:hypothetical protein J3F84DRAFT_405299, partial [Trichoderma pleuroticola]
WGFAIVRIRSRRYCAARLPWPTEGRFTKSDSLRGVVWGAEYVPKTAAPPPQSCQPQMPRTLPQGRRHTVRGTLAVALQALQALFGELRSAPRAVRALCAQSPQRRSGRWLQHLFLSSSTITPAKRPPGRISAAAFPRPSVAILQRVQKAPWTFSSPSLRCASGAASPQTVLPNAPGDPRLPPSGLLAGPVPLYVFHCPSHTCQVLFPIAILSTLPPSFFSSSAQTRALPCFCIAYE